MKPKAYPRPVWDWLCVGGWRGAVCELGEFRDVDSGLGMSRENKAKVTHLAKLNTKVMAAGDFSRPHMCSQMPIRWPS